MSVGQMSLRRLREAIQNNRVSFPSQIPTFLCQSRADIQWRLVELYFVRNWSCPELGQRYGMTMERARQIIFNWVQRAVALGYLQDIPPVTAPLIDTPALEISGCRESGGIVLLEVLAHADGFSGGSAVRDPVASP